MNILFLGDIMGRSGREVVFRELPNLKRNLEIDIVIINGENAAGGFGITPKICEDFYELGVNVIIVPCFLFFVFLNSDNFFFIDPLLKFILYSFCL